MSSAEACQCPVCGASVLHSEINEHLDSACRSHVLAPARADASGSIEESQDGFAFAVKQGSEDYAGCAGAYFCNAQHRAQTLFGKPCYWNGAKTHILAWNGGQWVITGAEYYEVIVGQQGFGGFHIADGTDLDTAVWEMYTCHRQSKANAVEFCVALDSPEDLQEVHGKLAEKMQELGFAKDQLADEPVVTFITEAGRTMNVCGPQDLENIELPGQMKFSFEMKAERREEATTCAVCLEEEPHIVMPCCGKAGSTTGYCRRCIEIIVEQGQGVGTCPSCRKFLKLDARGEICITDRHAECGMCRQVRVIVDRDMCDACVLGQRHTLRYECQGCHAQQQIPHPMWRYQPGPTEFGTCSWACHRGCQNFTNWRVVAEDAAKVPDSDCPEGWGRREQWLRAVREQRHQERVGGRRRAQQKRDDGCVAT